MSSKKTSGASSAASSSKPSSSSAASTSGSSASSSSGASSSSAASDKSSSAASGKSSSAAPSGKSSSAATSGKSSSAATSGKSSSAATSGKSSSAAPSGKSSSSAASGKSSSSASGKSSSAASSSPSSSGASSSGASSSRSSSGASSNKSSSGASSSKSSSGASSSKSKSGDQTEKDLSEIAPPAPSASQYNVGVSAAASAYAKSVRNFDNYSCVGPVKKDADKSFAKAVQQMQAASKMGPAGGGSVMAKKTGKRAFIMRHGERMDRLFPEWLTMAITDQGTYMPYDMNMPLVMIDRSSMGGWNAYEYDSPVTEMGNLSGQMIGRGLKSCGIDIKSLYCSPSLRCIQTASGVLKTLENMDVRINVEPGLFEWLAWYDSMPKWLDASVLVQAKHRVNEQYQPVMSVSELAGKKAESTKEYYERISNVVKKIVEKQTGAGSILIVGHGSTMDAGVRSLVGKPTSEINRGEMDQMGMHYPYCSIVAAEEGQGQKWAVQPAVLPQLTFLGFSNRFNPDYLNRP